MTRENEIHCEYNDKIADLERQIESLTAERDALLSTLRLSAEDIADIRKRLAASDPPSPVLDAKLREILREHRWLENTGYCCSCGHPATIHGNYERWIDHIAALNAEKAQPELERSLGSTSAQWHHTVTPSKTEADTCMVKSTNAAPAPELCLHPMPALGVGIFCSRFKGHDSNSPYPYGHWPNDPNPVRTQPASVAVGPDVPQPKSWLDYSPNPDAAAPDQITVSERPCGWPIYADNDVSEAVGTCGLKEGHTGLHKLFKPLSYPEGQPRGTTECPICGEKEPHFHPREDVFTWLKAKASSFGYNVFISDSALCSLGSEEPCFHGQDIEAGAQLAGYIANIQSLHAIASVVGNYLLKRDAALVARTREEIFEEAISIVSIAIHENCAWEPGAWLEGPKHVRECIIARLIAAAVPPAAKEDKTCR